MEFCLLGEVEARHDGVRLRLGGKQRAVLAVLLYQVNAVVPRSEIIRQAWGERAGDAPRTVEDLVADYVSRLRMAFKNAGAQDEVRLIAREPGYLIEVDQQTVDWHRFRMLVNQARAAQDAADVEDAARLLHQALGLWRGPALGGIGSALGSVRTQMEDRRLSAAEDLAAIELALGGADRVVDLLVELADQHPARERLAALLIQALHVTGRREEAIAAYQRTLRVLREEYGLDPSEGLEKAYRALLSDQRPVAPPVVAATGAPAQLPLDTSNFTGREVELDVLLGLVPSEPEMVKGMPADPGRPVDPGQASGLPVSAGLPAPAGSLAPADPGWRTGRPPRPGVICVIDGMAGVGKTAFAVHAAHLIAPRFPNGQLFLDLHGYTDHIGRVEPEAALDRLLRAMGVRGDAIPQHLDDRAALYRERLAGTRMLILLDDAYSADQVRPLVPPAGCLLLVTSRRRLTALDDAHPISLESLPVSDAVTLFTKVAGPGRITGQHEAVERIANLCGGLPLAIRIAAARLRNHPAWMARHLADRLANEREQPGELNDGERSIGAAFTLSYRDLADEQQRMFRLLSLAPGRDIDAYAAAALTDVSLSRAGRLVKDLLDAHLLSQDVEDRYGFHDLMRAYAAALALVEDSPADRGTALTRLLDHQLHAASAAVDLLFPHEADRRPRPPAAATPAPPVRTRAEAKAWLDAEWANLVEAGKYAAGHGWPDRGQQFDAVLFRYLLTSAHYTEALDLHEHALAAARRQGDRAGEGLALEHIGGTYRRLGRYEDALEHFRQALTVRREVGDRAAEAVTLMNLGIIYGVHGKYQQAADHLHQALAIDGEIGNQANQANTLSNLGNIHQLYGRYDEALRYYSQALAICAEIGDRAGEASALTNLGTLHERRGHHEDAIEHHHQALRIFAEVGDRAGEGTALTNLAQVHSRRGRHEIALDQQHQALRIFRAIGDRPGQADTLAYLGDTYASVGRHPEAVDHYSRALAIARDIGDHTLQTTVFNGLGETLRAAGRPDDALVRHRSALALAAKLGNRYERARALHGIAELLHAAGEAEAARRNWTDALALYTELGVPEAQRLRERLAAVEGGLGSTG